MIRDIAKKLSVFTEFTDFVIIELEYRRGIFESSAEILRKNSSRVILRASSFNVEVLVKMIRPRREINLVNERAESAEKIWRVFNTSEILEFVTAVGDKNKIHPPIVPGFLILETICAEFNADFIRLKFKNFITANEPLILQGKGNTFEIYGTGEQKILISIM